MATETFNVIEGDGSSDQVTLTDDPVENATVQAVKDAIGDETTASEKRDPSTPATQIERLTAVVSILLDTLSGGSASDQLRVDIEGESVDVAKDTTLSSVDALLGDQSDAGETDETNAASLIAFLKGAVELLGGTLTVTDDGSLVLDGNAGTVIGDVQISDLSSVTGQSAKSGSLPVTLASDEDNVPTDQQTPVAVEDSAGTQIDPSRATDFPDAGLAGGDLTASAQTVGPVAVGRSQSLLIRVHENDGGSVDVSVDWEDANGNSLGSQSATEIGMSGVTTDHARLFRKGAQARVTFTNSSGATSTNAFIDTHK